MRYAVLADIHGNLPALEAVLDAAERIAVDAYLVAGDLVGYGPFPNECVEAVERLGATVVHGNHDLIALGMLSGDRCIPLARRSLEWTRTVLSADARDYLHRLPMRAEAEGGIVITHGSLDDTEEYTHLPEQAAAQLARLPGEHPGCHTLVVGHTHRPMACDDRGRLLTPGRDGSLELDPQRNRLINPGAVGQSRERSVRARFLTLDLSLSVLAFHAVEYDVARCEVALASAGLATSSMHLRPRLAGTLRRAVRHAVHRARRTVGRVNNKDVGPNRKVP